MEGERPYMTAETAPLPGVERAENERKEKRG